MAGQSSEYFDSALGMNVVQVLPGECHLSDSDEVITTVLGSCIAICMRDPASKIGGLNHFLLPESKTNSGEDYRYGTHAMEILINGILKRTGTKANLEVKMFGGGKMFDSEQEVGHRNIEFARKFLSDEGLEIVSEDVGLEFPRRIRYFPATGKVQVKRLRSLHNKQITQVEKELASSVRLPPANDELFDELFD